jgi:hypothetical protein
MGKAGRTFRRIRPLSCVGASPAGRWMQRSQRTWLAQCNSTPSDLCKSCRIEFGAWDQSGGVVKFSPIVGRSLPTTTVRQSGPIGNVYIADGFHT